MLEVEIESLRRGEIVDAHLILGDTVTTLISPRRFTLAPEETQTVRLWIREPVTSGELFRLSTLFTPARERMKPEQSDATIQAGLVLRTCIISKVRVR